MFAPFGVDVSLRHVQFPSSFFARDTVAFCTFVFEGKSVLNVSCSTSEPDVKSIVKAAVDFCRVMLVFVRKDLGGYGL